MWEVRYHSNMHDTFVITHSCVFFYGDQVICHREKYEISSSTVRNCYFFRRRYCDGCSCRLIVSIRSFHTLEGHTCYLKISLFFFLWFLLFVIVREWNAHFPRNMISFKYSNSEQFFFRCCFWSVVLSHWILPHRMFFPCPLHHNDNSPSHNNRFRLLNQLNCSLLNKQTAQSWRAHLITIPQFIWNGWKSMRARFAAVSYFIESSNKIQWIITANSMWGVACYNSSNETQCF